MIRMIAAVSLNNVIGLRGSSELLWDSEMDMHFFKSSTEGETVVLGSNTFKSLGSKALPNRRNIVLSSTLKQRDHLDVEIYDDYIELLKDYSSFFVIGGEALYNLFLPFADELILSTVSIDYTDKADYAYFPSDTDDFILAKESSVIQDVDRKTNKKINIIFTRWTRRIDVKH